MKRIAETFIVFQKEIIDGIRDIRSVIITFLLPLLLFPLLSLMLSTQNQEKILHIATIELSDHITKHLSDDKNIKLHEGINDASDKLMQHKYHAVLTQRTKENYSTIEILYNNGVKNSIEAMEYVKVKLLEFRMNKILSSPDYQSDDPLVVYVPIQNVYKGSSQFILFSVLPILLIVISVTSPISLAADTFAGEKERNSLEILLSTGIAKSSLIAGKYLAVNLYGFGGIVSFLLGFVISFKINSSLFGISKIIIDFKDIVLIIVLLVPLLLFLSSIEILISIFAKSAKEAQLYIIPITVSCMSLTAISENLYFSTSGNSIWLSILPLINIIHSIRKIIMNEFINSYLFIIIFSNVISSLFLLIICRYIIEKEKIIYRN